MFGFVDVVVGFGHLLHASDGLASVLGAVEREVFFGEEAGVTVAEALHQFLLFAACELVYVADGEGEGLFFVLIDDAVGYGHGNEESQGSLEILFVLETGGASDAPEEAGDALEAILNAACQLCAGAVEIEDEGGLTIWVNEDTCVQLAGENVAVGESVTWYHLVVVVLYGILFSHLVAYHVEVGE